MPHIALTDRFFESTRGRVVALVRRGINTVEGLAEELGLTDNAVRVHLAVLERDGIVRETGVQRGGVGKPATLYGIAPEAEPAFSHAYVPLLQSLLAALADDLPSERLERLMRDVGRRMAATLPQPHGNVRQRVALAAELLEELGGVAEVTENAGAVRITGQGCPLSAVVGGRPEVCLAVTSLLAELTGAEVTECCEHGERQRCGFQIALRRAR